MKYLSAGLAAFGLLAAPAMASAATAWASGTVNLRAGPAADYPRIATLRGGQQVDVLGCLRDWSWCDVSASGHRGWVSGAFLDYGRQNQRARINKHGSASGLPIVTFTVSGYWNQHYRDQSWYGQRSRLEQRHPQHTDRAQPAQQSVRTGGKEPSQSAGRQQQANRQDAQPAHRDHDDDRQKKPDARQK